MNVARKQMFFLLIVAVATMLLSAINAFAGPGRTTYQAKIVKPDGYPLEASNVNFKFTILDPAGACILFSETYSAVNMTSTGGLISFSLGSGVKTYPVSSPTFEDVFSNITPSLSCDVGGPPTYSPAATDIRKIVMQFHDGGGWQTLPAMNINAVPYAMYANNAQKLNGKADTDFVQVSVVPTCTASEAIRYNGTVFSCVSVGGSGAVSSGSVITALGYTPADGASLTTITSNISNVSSTVTTLGNSVSALQSSVGVSFAAITSSQWVTSGTKIYYSGGNVGIGTSNPTRVFEVFGTSATANVMGLRTHDYSLGGSGTTMTFQFGAVSGNTYGSINVLSGGGLVGNTLVFQSTSGTVGIGTSSNVTKLVVSGGVKIGMESATCNAALAGTLRYNAGLIEYCNGTDWPAFGVAGAGITLLNGSSSGTQTFVTGISGTNFNITSNSGVHSFNIPYAASASVTAGLLSNADYLAFTNKVSATSAAVISALGYAPASATAVSALTSNLATVSNTVTSLSTNTAASFAAITSSQWNTSGTSINYVAGDVGIGTNSPVSPLQIAGDGSYQFHISGATNPNRRLRMGYDTNYNYGAIQALNFGTVFENLMLNPAGGYVGIGILSASPTATLSVSGTTDFTANNTALPAPGSNGTVNAHNRVVEASPSVNYTTGLGGTQFLIGDKSAITISSATTATDLTRLYLFGQQHVTTYAATAPTTQVVGTNFLTVLTSAGAVANTAKAMAATLRLTNSNAVNGDLQGMTAAVAVQGSIGSTGAAANVTGILSSVTIQGANAANTFTMGNVYGVRSAVGILNTSSGTMTNAYGMYIDDGSNIGTNGGTIVNQYGLYIENQSLGTNTKYNIYSAGANSKNYFEGTVDIGNGNLSSSGSIITTSNVTAPIIYGGSAPSGNLTIDSTSSATKGNILIAPSGGFVGIGTANPTGSLHVALNNPSTAMATVSDAFVLQNKNATSGSLTSILFANQNGFATGQIAALQNTGNFGSKMILATKTGGGGAWNNSQLVLDTNGNVGIGNATPAGRLEITPPNDTSTALYIGESNVNNTTGLYFSRWGSASAPMGIQGTIAGVGAGPIALQAQAGNVGIGTTAPDEKLTVAGGALAIINTARWDHMVLSHDGASARFDAGGAENGLAIRVENGSVDYPATSYNEVMRLMPTGRVGIGTATPGSRFQIATPASGGVNNRWVSGNSNGDPIDMSGANGDMYLDHIVGARITSTSSATINRAATFKIDAAPNLDAASSATLTVNNLYAFWVEAGASIFGGSVGVGVSGTPSSYGHGGTNKFIEIQNPGTAIHSQSHLFLTTGVSQITSSSIGTLTWAQPNVSAARKEVAWISASTESASAAAPAANLQIHTRSTTDAAPVERMRVTSTGRVGIGVTNPVTLLSNVAATANNANVGDSGGTGENANSLNWSTDLAGYSAAITNTSNSPGANGLNLRTRGTTSNFTILSAGVGVSSTANSYDVLTVKANQRVGINQAAPLGALTVNGTFALQPSTSDHIYMEFYARTATPTTRSGWFGYGGAGTNLLSVTNETPGHINIDPEGGGYVGINNINPTRLLHVGSAAIGSGVPVANFQNVDGTCTLTPAAAGSGIACSSDERLKENFADLGGLKALEKILKFQAVSYNFKTSKNFDRHTGYRAQEVKKILPEIVRTDDNGFFQVYYDALIPWITEAIKEMYSSQQTQAREIASVKAENAQIKAENEKLKERLDRLEKAINKSK